MASKGWHPGLGRAPRTRSLAQDEIYEATLAQAVSAIQRAERASQQLRMYGYSIQNQLLDYLELVFKEITRAKIKDSKTLLKVMAQSQEWLLVNRAIGGDSIWKQLEGNHTRLESYRIFVNKFMKQGFNLYVYDGSAPEWLQGRFGVLAYRLEEQVEKILYDELENSFVEAWNGVSTEAFPLEYRTHILGIIRKLRETRAFSRSGGAGFFTGPQNVLGWKLMVDFNRLFGDSVKLYEGYHFGALTAAGGRVSLPYDEEELKNPGEAGTGNGYIIRYSYWKALWSGKSTTGKMYFPYQGKSRPDTARKLMEIRTRQLNNIGKKAKSEGRWSEKKGYRLTDKEISSARGYMDTISRMETALSVRGGRKTKDMPHGIPIPPGARETTIKARLAFWGDQAPFWLYLEYGQLKSDPRIPPRGVYYRFYRKAIRAIKILVDKSMKDMFPKKGPVVTAGYNVPIAPREGRFKSPTLSREDEWKGVTLPAGLKRKREEGLVRVLRSAEEASRVAGEYTIRSPATVRMLMAKTQSDKLPRTGLPKAQTVPTISGPFKQRSNSFMQDASTGRMMGSRPGPPKGGPLPSYKGGRTISPPPVSRASSRPNLRESMDRIHEINLGGSRYQKAKEFRSTKAFKHFYRKSGGDIAQTAKEYSAYLDRQRRKRKKKYSG